MRHRLVLGIILVTVAAWAAVFFGHARPHLNGADRVWVVTVGTNDDTSDASGRTRFIGARNTQLFWREVGIASTLLLMVVGGVLWIARRPELQPPPDD